VRQDHHRKDDIVRHPTTEVSFSAAGSSGSYPLRNEEKRLGARCSRPWSSLAPDARETIIAEPFVNRIMTNERCDQVNSGPSGYARATTCTRRFSGGQQRIAIARHCLSPALIVLDEPVSA
jgi:ABC-type microcin C transport system duplicated ATPase subunit YejF